jgi:hypothetical protein
MRKLSARLQSRAQTLLDEARATVERVQHDGHGMQAQHETVYDWYD